jgi:RNAse (barnase) inhibitor barstar
MSQTGFESGPPGVQRLDRADDQALLSQLRLQPQSVVRINLTQACDKAAIMKALGAALHLPDSFGGNLDALADCLTDPDYAPTGIVLLEGLADRPGLMREDLLEVFEDAIAARAVRQAAFQVYWLGAET